MKLLRAPPRRNAGYRARTPDRDWDVLLKMVIIGDACCGECEWGGTFSFCRLFTPNFHPYFTSFTHPPPGKSSFHLRAMEDLYHDYFYGGVGIDFKIKTFSLEGVIAKLQFWDTAGQERFGQRLTNGAYYRGVHVIMLAFDVTSRDSFASLASQWVPEARRHAYDETAFLIVGMKADMESERTVSYEEAEECEFKRFVFRLGGCWSPSRSRCP